MESRGLGDVYKRQDKTVNEESNSKEEQKEELSQEDKLREIEDKLTRSYAELENQRRRYEKEKDEAYEFGGMALAKECLNLTDNLERSKLSIINDESLEKNNKDKIVLIFGKGHENFQIFSEKKRAFNDNKEVKKILNLKK